MVKCGLTHLVHERGWKKKPVNHGITYRNTKLVIRKYATMSREVLLSGIIIYVRIYETVVVGHDGHEKIK